MTSERVHAAGDEAVGKSLAQRLTALGIDENVLTETLTQGPDGLRRLLARYGSFPGARRYTSPEVCELAGVEDETAKALWRAMGFPVVPDDQVAFTDEDVAALRAAKKLSELTGEGSPVHLQQARSMGQAAARVAASQLDVFASSTMSAGAQLAAASELPQEATLEAAQQVLDFVEETLPTLDHLLVYMYRRHLAAAAEQIILVAPGEEGARLSVGFADLSGFTALSQSLDSHDLASLIDRFNGTTADLVTEAGGRVVKTIGDEVMFTTHDAGSAAALALALIERISSVEDLPRLKVGLAHGSVITREGDVFGAPVNLAKRLVATAKPASVLVDETTHDALQDDPRFGFTTLARQYLKGFGHVRAYRLRAAGTAPGRRHSRH